jgi:hypothetical protein
MAELPPNKFQWKWVWISLSMYIVFYFLPLSLVPGGLLSDKLVTPASGIFIGAWSIGGMIIISAIAGFISNGVTIKEPVVAALGLLILWFIAVQIKFNSVIHFNRNSLWEFLIFLGIVGLLALGGASFGELIQKSGRKKIQQ